MNSPDVLAVEASGQHAVALLDLDVRIKLQVLDDLFEQVLERLHGLQLAVV